MVESHLRGRGTGRLGRYGPHAGLFNAASMLLLLLGIMATAISAPALAGKLTLVTLGDSLSAGYGLPREAAFTSQLEAALRAKGYDVSVPNTGVSGETTAGGLSRLDWILADKPDLVLVALGANDGLRGMDPAVTKANLDKILSKLATAKVPAILVGMLAPRNLGKDYGATFDGLYAELAARHNVPLHPFFLDGVAMQPDLNLDDGMHPNAKGVAIMVSRILPVVTGALDRLKAAAPTIGQ